MPCRISKSKLKQTIINLPLVGTFIYNLLMNPKRIDRQFRFIYYCRPQLISSKTKDAYYEAAHMDNSNGKYLYSSLLGNYMNIDLRHAVKKITKPVSFIISSDIKANYKTAQEYRKLNSNIDITYVSNCKLYPQLENPEKVYQIIENKLSIDWKWTVPQGYSPFFYNSSINGITSFSAQSSGKKHKLQRIFGGHSGFSWIFFLMYRLPLLKK